MYCVRFVRSDDNPVEEYYYNTMDAAEDHMDMFMDDDSGLYRYIAVMDMNENIVLQILVFEDGEFREKFWDDDIVKLRDGYRAPGEEEFIYRVSNMHEDTGRCTITCINGVTELPMSEIVGLETIDRVVEVIDIYD